SAFNVTTNTDVNGYGVRLVKAYPKLTKLAVPSNTLVNGSMVLYRFSVTAPAEGDVSLYKFTFSVSSTTVGTTTNFYVDRYSDATFQVQAYGNNPLNARQVDIVGEDSLNGIASTSATEREVEVYFDPQTKDATNPNAEAIQVPAGLTRYFQLRGTVASSVAGDSILVSLLGDAAYFDRTSVRFLEAASTTVDAQKTNNDFITR
ncbi:MAG: hypothetical protein HYT40_01780, partial [Candidatus Sungbacteria bacterium]|nr:hypothetical protein [Candidatus Sungbacteria bacterium]